MDNFLKKLARFSIKHPFWGNFEAYYWRFLALFFVASIVCRYSIDFSSWSMRESNIFVATVVTIFAVLLITILFLPLLINGVKKNLPEVVIPNVDDIWRDNPQLRPIIGRLIRIATNDDDADLLRRWIFYFNEKKNAENRMASFEMQFLSKG